MTIEIPNECECEGKDFVCNYCIWNTACAIEELRESFEKEVARWPQDNDNAL